eukprot:COSAG02_NODE_11547_length_1701_cov_2.011860_2_plen_84_part_00
MAALAPVSASTALLMLSTLLSGAQSQQSWLVDDYASFNALVCSVIHNAQEQVRPPPAPPLPTSFILSPVCKSSGHANMSLSHR